MNGLKNALLTLAVSIPLRRANWIREGDLKLDV